MTATIEHADVMDWCKAYDGPKSHALLCDPPYELGFMGKDWDKTGIVFDPDTWAALAEHLHPGGFGMAFASSRGWHRLAVAIEDAGLRIHPSIFGWVFGSGFPKATRVKDTPEFEGHRYGLQAMKPALEPIIVFQKPYKGKAVESIVETGAGALNIDGARIGTEPGLQRPARQGKGISGGWAGYTQEPGKYGTEDGQGRWPANFYVDEEAAARLGEQSGNLTSGANPTRRGSDKFRGTYQPYEGQRECVAHRGTDSGSASRFFFNVNRQIDEADPVMYQAKASRKERDAGLEGRNRHTTVKPIDLTRWLAALLLPPPEYAPRRILVPFAGSGSEMIGAYLSGWEEIIGIEMEREYAEIAKARIAYWESRPKQLEL